jgi:glycosyltransferase involved in cell wall biosynthesis
MVASLRRLALFAYYFPPLGGAGSQRALSFARHLPEHGWEVVVVTPREGVFGKDSSLLQDGIPGVRVIRTGTLEPAVIVRKLLKREEAGSSVSAGDYVEEVEVGAVGRAIRSWARERIYFPDSSRGWISHAVRAAGREHRKAPFSVVLSSSPPVSAHVAAERFSSKQGIPWVADWRDLWTDRVPLPVARMLDAQEMESRMLRSAAAVFAPMDALRDHLRGKRGQDPVVTVRNGFEPIDFSGPVRRPPEDGIFRIVYTGTLYSPEEQFPGAVFEALRRIRSRPGSDLLRVRFLGKVHPGAMDLAKAAGIVEGLEMDGFLPHAKCLEAMADSRLLLMMATDKGDRALNVEVPAKTYEYLAARRPILALADPASETGRILGNRAGVWVCPFRDTDGIERAIVEAMQIKNPVLPPWPDIAEFTRATQAAKVAEVLDQVVASGAR